MALKTALPAVAALRGLAGAACTTDQVYRSTRTLRVDQCQELSIPEREECLRQTHETEAEREDRETEAADPPEARQQRG